MAVGNDDIEMDEMSSMVGFVTTKGLKRACETLVPTFLPPSVVGQPTDELCCFRSQKRRFFADGEYYSDEDASGAVAGHHRSPLGELEVGREGAVKRVRM